VVIPSNGGSLVIPLLKAFPGDWTLSRVKAHYLPCCLVWMKNELMQCYLPRGIDLENLFWSVGAATSCDVIAAVGHCLHRCGLCFLLLLLLFFGYVIFDI
jgi:hypothetical protein